jgi:precorrin-6B methylase 2
VQQQVPPEKLSGVVSFDALGSFTAIPIGCALIGPVSDVIGIEAAFAAAALILAASIAFQVSVREIRELRAPVREPRPVTEAA